MSNNNLNLGNAFNVNTYQNEPGNLATAVPIPQKEISQSVINTGIVSGIVIAVILFLIFRPMNSRIGWSVPWWVKILIVGVIAWIFNMWVLNTFYPVIAGTFRNTTPLFEGVGVIAAVGVFAIMDSWSEKGLFCDGEGMYAHRKMHSPRRRQRMASVVVDEE